MARPKRRRPYDPSRVHDRRATEFSRGVAQHVAPHDVDDPYAPGEQIRVMRTLRDDPLARLHDRKQIDEAQFRAGRAFQNDFEEAERGPRAIDPAKEFVDGGLPPEAISEGQRKAGIRLAHAHKKLGADGSAIVHDVLIHGRAMSEVASMRGLSGKSWEEYFGKRFRECLHCLAKLYGFATEATGKHRILADSPYG